MWLGKAFQSFTVLGEKTQDISGPSSETQGQSVGTRREIMGKIGTAVFASRPD